MDIKEATSEKLRYEKARLEAERQLRGMWIWEKLRLDKISKELAIRDLTIENLK